MADFSASQVERIEIALVGGKTKGSQIREPSFRNELALPCGPDRLPFGGGWLCAYFDDGQHVGSVRQDRHSGLSAMFAKAASNAAWTLAK